MLSRRNPYSSRKSSVAPWRLSTWQIDPSIRIPASRALSIAWPVEPPRAYVIDNYDWEPAQSGAA